MDVKVDVDMDTSSKEQKVGSKRGRKKKEVIETNTEPKIKKKRGRKAALKFFSSSIRKKIPITSNTNSTENVILQLNVSEHEIDETSQVPVVSGTSPVVSGTSPVVSGTSPVVSGTSPEDQNLLSYSATENWGFPLIQLKELPATPAFTDGDVAPMHKTGCSELPRLPTQQEQVIGNGFITLFDNQDEKWPERTNIHCWWCCHGFDNVPLGLPLEYSFVKSCKRNMFKVKGNFCSIACILAWYNSNPKYSHNPKIFNLIKFLNRKLGDGRLNPVSAPPRETLKIFGGKFSIEEFRKATNNGYLYKLIDYPMVIVKEFVEEIDLNNLRLHNEKLNRAATENETITKPTNLVQNAKIRIKSKLEKLSTENTIDKFLNMKIS
jgi:hypothetical protein